MDTSVGNALSLSISPEDLAFGIGTPSAPLILDVRRPVRTAHTDQLPSAPQTAGLLAMSLGLARLHAANDQDRQEAAMPRYDALYALCRQEASGQHEGHCWEPGAAGQVVQA